MAVFAPAGGGEVQLDGPGLQAPARERDHRIGEIGAESV